MRFRCVNLRGRWVGSGRCSSFIAVRPTGSGEGIEQLAARCVALMRERQPEGPYVVGGYSFGGTVAFEIARQLEADAQAVSRVVIVDTLCPTWKMSVRDLVPAGARWMWKTLGIVVSPAKLRRRSLRQRLAQARETVRRRAGSRCPAEDLRSSCRRRPHDHHPAAGGHGSGGSFPGLPLDLPERPENLLQRDQQRRVGLADRSEVNTHLFGHLERNLHVLLREPPAGLEHHVE